MGLARAAPAVAPTPDTMFNRPGGSPACKKGYKYETKDIRTDVVKIYSAENHVFSLFIKRSLMNLSYTSWNSFAAYKEDNGVCSIVFRTTVLPHANVGSTFQPNMTRGKFQGMIWPTTPICSCNVCTWCGLSAGTVKPWILSAQPGGKYDNTNVSIVSQN